MAFSAQYITGMGFGGGTLWTGKKAEFFKARMLLGQVSANTGQPQTTIYLAATSGTGVTGNLRSQFTGVGPHAAPAGFHLNPAAYTAAIAGAFGNAGAIR